MGSMLRWLVGLIVVVAFAAGITYAVAGRGAPPHLTINKPDRVIGQSGALDVTVEAPDARFTALAITLEQDGRSTPLYTLKGSDPSVTLTSEGRDQLRISRTIGRQSIPDLKSGSARIVVSATRPSFLNLRQLTSTASKDIQVR